MVKFKCISYVHRKTRGYLSMFSNNGKKKEKKEKGDLHSRAALGQNTQNSLRSVHLKVINTNKPNTFWEKST